MFIKNSVLIVGVIYCQVMCEDIYEQWGKKGKIYKEAQLVPQLKLVPGCLTKEYLQDLKNYLHATLCIFSVTVGLIYYHILL
jgi:hypothetical protein